MGTRQLHLDQNADKQKEEKIFKEFVVTPILNRRKTISLNTDEQPNEATKYN